VAELQELEEVRGLITRGQQVGVLTYAEIEIATAEFGLDETDVGELHGLFECLSLPEVVNTGDSSRSRARRLTGRLAAPGVSRALILRAATVARSGRAICPTSRCQRS
jgi:RNA polymerase primary sigma factor